MISDYLKVPAYYGRIPPELEIRWTSAGRQFAGEQLIPVGQVRGILRKVAGDDLSLVEDQCGSQLLDIFARNSRQVAGEDGGLKAGPPDRRPGDFGEAAPFDLEQLIEFPIRIAEGVDILELITGQELACLAAGIVTPREGIGGRGAPSQCRFHPNPASRLGVQA